MKHTLELDGIINENNNLIMKCRLLSELRKALNYWLLSFIFVTFLINWHLSLTASSVFWCRYYFVCCGLTYKTCMVCYRVIAAPSSVVMSLHTVTLVMMIQNAQWTMSSLFSLKFFLILKNVDKKVCELSWLCPGLLSFLNIYIAQIT